MSINNDKESEKIESKFSKLNLVTNDHDNCYKPYINGKFWCKECVPSCIIEGWTNGNSEIDTFDRFEDIKQIGNIIYKQDNGKLL